MRAPANLPASVMARLLARAKERGEDFHVLFTAYAFERLLYRLGASSVRDRFVLKGAMLLRLWADRPYRATRDLDLLRKGDGSVEAIRADLVAILTAVVEDDAMQFDVDGMSVEGIRAGAEYEGVRVAVPARCGKARLSLQLDIGVGDDAWPPPRVERYPTLLDAAAPAVLAYATETVVAEKLEAIVVLGDRNSRIKDFFDLHMLATTFAFDRRTLVDAVGRTFERRRTPIPMETPIGLRAEYWTNPSRPAQTRAFARRAGVDVPDDGGVGIGALLAEFLWPVLRDLREHNTPDSHWVPGGPWESDGQQSVPVYKD